MIYKFMNESIMAILQGLSPKRKDRILSICSCAQPFGMLEYLTEGSILAIDNNPRQIKFAKRVLGLIKEDDKKAIEELNLTPKDGNYFTRGKRLERIAKNAQRLRFEFRNAEQPEDLQGTFTKGYFSNVSVDLPKYAPFFENGALVYVTYASTLLPDRVTDFLRQRSASWNVDIQEMFELDERRTREACKIEHARKLGYHKDNNGSNDFSDWTPAIFVRK